MRREALPRYSFRGLARDDLALVAGWMSEPHWTMWWGDAAAELALIEGHLDSPSVEPLIVELGGRPIAYLQSYDPHLEDDHPYRDQPFGTIGVDLSIGPAELVGIGHGSAMLRQFSELLFSEGAPRAIIDPQPDNVRALRAYAKAGFHPLGARSSIYGEVVLMARDAAQS